nr:heavy metal-associated isoprenylated plant protein 7-like [Ipomoea batatas]
MRVFMHCEGCARKVRRCLKDFDGVEDVVTDCKTHKVVVKGEKADPVKVLERVQKKSHRQLLNRRRKKRRLVHWIFMIFFLHYIYIYIYINKQFWL